MGIIETVLRAGSLRNSPLLTQISVILVLGAVAYSLIGFSVYYMARRKMRRYGIEATIWPEAIGGWLACIIATYGIWLLR